MTSKHEPSPASPVVKLGEQASGTDYAEVTDPRPDHAGTPDTSTAVPVRAQSDSAGGAEDYGFGPTGPPVPNVDLPNDPILRTDRL